VASIRKLKDSGRYQVRWRSPDGKQTSETFARKTDANACKSRVETQLAQNDYVDPRRGRVVVADLTTQWLNDPSWAPTTKARASSILRKYILPRWGRTRLDQVSHEDVQEWVNDLTMQPARPSSKEKISPYHHAPRALPRMRRDGTACPPLSQTPARRARLRWAAERQHQTSRHLGLRHIPGRSSHPQQLVSRT